MFTRTTLITGFAWAFGGLRSVSSPEQARGSPKQHRYVDTDEELGPVRPRLSVMILPQVPRFTSLQGWGAADHISIPIHGSPLCDL